MADNNHRKPATPKAKKKPLRYDQKMDVIRRIEKGEKKARIAEFYKVNESTIRTIYKNKDTVLKCMKAYRTVSIDGRVRCKDEALIWAERCLDLFILRQGRMNIQVDGPMLRNKATTFHSVACRRLGLTPAKPFHASPGWFQSFMKRKGLKNVHVTGERASADVNAASSFPAILQAEIADEGYSTLTIFNMDETGMQWKCLPSTTYISKQQRQARGRKPDKSRYTVILCTNAAGNFKMKPFVIHKAKKPRAFKNLRDMSETGVHWRQQGKAWATSNLVVEWFDLFVRDAKQHCKKHGVPFKVLLLLDNAPCHPQHLASRHPQVKVVFFPPNTTSLLQPLDQEIIANTKVMYSQYMYKKFLGAVTSIVPELQVLQEIEVPASTPGSDTEGEAGSDDEGDTIEADTTTPRDVLSVAEFWRRYNMKDSIEGLLRAWGKLSQATIIHAWRLILPNFHTSTHGEPQELTQQLEEAVNVAQQVPGCAEVTAEGVMEVVNTCTNTIDAVVDEVMEEDTTVDAGSDKQADDECEAVIREPTMKNLSDILVNIDRIKEEVQEWDGNEGRCGGFLAGLEKLVEPYKDLYNRRFNERRQEVITRYFARRTQPQPEPQPQSQPQPQPQPGSSSDNDDNLSMISEADFEGFLNEVEDEEIRIQQQRHQPGRQ